MTQQRLALCAARWLAEREAELLPVPYFHAVFTLPARKTLRPLVAVVNPQQNLSPPPDSTPVGWIDLSVTAARATKKVRAEVREYHSM
jgi:hypothetical protein